MTNTYTYIFCDGGLGNRMGCLIGGLYFAKETNRTPIVIWPENNWCGCSFEDLFEFTMEFKNWGLNETVSNTNNFDYVVHEFSQFSQFNLNLFQNNYESLIHFKEKKTNVVYYHNVIPEYIDEQIQLNHLKNLKINIKILQEVKTFLNKFGNKKVYGIHFRKTDFHNFLNEDFYDNAIKQNLNDLFFVCSDDKETELKFKQNQNVITYEKNNYVSKLIDGSWNDGIIDSEGRRFRFNVNRSKQSVMEAFVDMLILSNTEIITPNTGSTFLNFSKLYKKIL